MDMLKAHIRTPAPVVEIAAPLTPAPAETAVEAAMGRAELISALRSRGLRFNPRASTEALAKLLE